MINTQSRHWEFKPPVGTMIDLSNPLSIGLVLAVPMNEIGAPPREILTGKTFTTGTLAWSSSTPYGPAQNANSLQSNVLSVLTSDSRLGFTVPPVTCCAFGTVASNSQYQLAFGVFDTGLDGGGRFGVGITSGNVYFLGCCGGVSTIPAPGSSAPFFAVMSYDGTNTNFFVNGVTQTVFTGATTAQNVGGIYLGGDNHTAGGPSNPSSPWNGVVAGAYAWNRVLSFEEMCQLYVSPWAVFNPPGGTIRYFIPAIATGATPPQRTLVGVGTYVALTLHASVWGAAWLVAHKFERERVAFVGEKADFQKEQSTFVATRALHAASKSPARCDLCSVCGKVVHKYDLLDDKVVCHDCQKKK